jgi:hypothetical protein
VGEGLPALFTASVGDAGGIWVSGSAKAVVEQSRQNETRVIICFKMYSFMMLLRFKSARSVPTAEVGTYFNHGI